VPNATAGGSVQVKPLGIEGDNERFTPPKPFWAVRVIVEVPKDPAGICAGVTMLAEIVKSVKVTVADGDV
jgi:hypothetical protein